MIVLSTPVYVCITTTIVNGVVVPLRMMMSARSTNTHSLTTQLNPVGVGLLWWKKSICWSMVNHHHPNQLALSVDCTDVQRTRIFRRHRPRRHHPTLALSMASQADRQGWCTINPLFHNPHVLLPPFVRQTRDLRCWRLKRNVSAYPSVVMPRVDYVHVIVLTR